jgi:hypothetical protein
LISPLHATTMFSATIRTRKTKLTHTSIKCLDVVTLIVLLSAILTIGMKYRRIFSMTTDIQ